jgi:hypothetical protein
MPAVTHVYYLILSANLRDAGAEVILRHSRSLSGIAFLPRPIQRFAGQVSELWRAGSDPVGSL